jgi:hypothetical protein
MAAMALPPQMADPKEIRVEVRWGILNNLPNRYPKTMVKLMLMAVYKKASLPVLTSSGRFMPNPSPITEACSKRLLQTDVVTFQGLPIRIPNVIPATSAIGALTRGQQHPSNAIQNNAFNRLLFFTTAPFAYVAVDTIDKTQYK